MIPSERQGGDCRETCENNKQCNVKGIGCQGWMWRMSDFLPVGLQNVLHRCKPEVRKAFEVALASGEKGAEIYFCPFDIA